MTISMLFIILFNKSNYIIKTDFLDLTITFFPAKQVIINNCGFQLFKRINIHSLRYLCHPKNQLATLYPFIKRGIFPGTIRP